MAESSVHGRDIPPKLNVSTRQLLHPDFTPRLSKNVNIWQTGYWFIFQKYNQKTIYRMTWWQLSNSTVIVVKHCFNKHYYWRWMLAKYNKNADTLSISFVFTEQGKFMSHFLLNSSNFLHSNPKETASGISGISTSPPFWGSLACQGPIPRPSGGGPSPCLWSVCTFPECCRTILFQFWRVFLQVFFRDFAKNYVAYFSHMFDLVAGSISCTRTINHLALAPLALVQAHPTASLRRPLPMTPKMVCMVRMHLETLRRPLWYPRNFCIWLDGKKNIWHHKLSNTFKYYCQHNGR